LNKNWKLFALNGLDRLVCSVCVKDDFGILFYSDSGVAIDRNLGMMLDGNVCLVHKNGVRRRIIEMFT
jgi:hypothetical protein